MAEGKTQVVMTGSPVLIFLMVVMMVVMCGGMIAGAGLAIRRRVRR